MGYVYFVRHGQTIWNVENKICGATDIALTELGHKQAIETGKKILEEGIKADEKLYLADLNPHRGMEQNLRLQRDSLSPAMTAENLCCIWHRGFTIFWMK